MTVPADKSFVARLAAIGSSGAFWSATFAFFVVTGGCRQNPTTVSGSVTLDGRPLAVRDGMRGTVVFQPAGGGTVLNGMIDGEGNYRLAAGSNSIVSPGTYAVTVSAVEITPASTDNPQPSGKRVTPSRYASTSQSGLQVEVALGPNDIDLHLISDSESGDGVGESSTIPSPEEQQPEPLPLDKTTQ